jgi:hypothetical protein
MTHHRTPRDRATSAKAKTAKVFPLELSTACIWTTVVIVVAITIGLMFNPS